MNTCLLIWVAGLLSVASGLYLWFSTSIGAEFAILLRDLGFFKQGTEDALEVMTRRDFSVWLILLESRQKLPRRLVHILQCPGCLSVHLSLLVSLLGCLCAARYVPSLQFLDLAIFSLVCILTWPWLVCRMTATSIQS
jgi:hypothetical protein